MSAVLVAGGATGIGAAVVRRLRDEGHDVVLVDRNAAAGDPLVAEDRPGAGWFVEVDLASADGPRRAVDTALAHTGGRLDAVFYNAGVLVAHPLSEWTVEEWDLSAAVNLRAPFLMAQAAAPHLARSGAGRIVLTSSTGALRGHAGMPAYHATKAGLIGLVRALADELAPVGTTVNAICPGWVDTPFNDGFWGHQHDAGEALAKLERSIPLGRQARPDDIVGSVLFLMSEAASYITGQSLVIDGGYTAV
ncbi:SDR family NAD(P)-dependent oxidoreductase [Microbacterium alcoholitolerans]|uniref:SDR family NAD(P)-dependent oxidoreductase n=1 Tax=unclassified Microbacterium TaxID=2609290 RepID=UPI003D184DF8